MTDSSTARASTWTRSVRTRVTLVVTVLSALAFVAVAVIAPGYVGNALDDDLLDTEADTVFAFTDLLTFATDAPPDAILDADGEPVAVQPGTVLTIESEPVEFGDAVEDVGVDLPMAASIEGTVQFIADRVDLLRRLDAFTALIDAAGGAFATDIGPLTSAMIDRDGNVETVEGAISELDVPVMTQFELDEYLFDDLGIVEVDSGSLVDVETDARILLGVREVEGLELLVAADASTVDSSVSGIRAGLWLAVPVLTLAIAALTWVVTSRALRPVRSITDQAATISGGSLDARVPVPDSGDEIAALAATVNEMLDRLELDDRTRRRFISDASHELRSPVAVMRNEAEVALEHPDATDKGQLATTVADESRRMSVIIDDLLALARHDEGVSAPTTEVDLDDIIIEEAARARRVPVDVGAVSAGRVRGRRDELGRVVGHLLDNAARHADSAAAASLRSVGDRIELSVDDDGPGVSPSDRDRIFERFARLDDARSRDRGGAGLGLAVVKGIVERSGGTVSVTDSPLGGARFTASFPR